MTRKTSFAVSASHSINLPSPEFALVFHGSMGRITNITHHGICRDSKQPSLGPATLFGFKDFQSIMDSIEDRPDSGPVLIDRDILSIERNGLTWMVGGKVRPMWYRVNGRELSFRVPWPTLILRVINRRLFIAALTSNRRPTLRTRLCHAPLMNVNNVGSVCTGNSKLPAFAAPENRQDWEDVVFNTCFSHTNHQQTLNLGGKSLKDVSDQHHMRFWRELGKKKSEVFPKDSLSRMPFNLKSFFQHTAA